MSDRYAWFAFLVFVLSLVGGVASYIWESDYLWWPVLFALLGCAVMIPLVVVRPLRAVLGALRMNQGPSDD